MEYFLGLKLSVNDVIDDIWLQPDKSSAAEAMPTHVLKQTFDLIAPYLTELFNCSLAADHVSPGFKKGFITLIVKKAGLDSTDVASYRLKSTLSVMMNLLESTVAHQLLAYSLPVNLLPTLQFGSRSGHLTETAVLQVMLKLLHAVDRGDLTAAFHITNHDIMLQQT